MQYNSFIRAIFLVQVGYNDFDHMLPVIYTLVNDSQLDFFIDVVFDSRSIFFSRDDIRLIYLQSLPNVRIHNAFPLDIYLNVYHKLSRFHNKVLKILCELLRRYIRWVIRDPNKIDWIALLGKSINSEPKCIVFCCMAKPRTDVIIHNLKDINSRIKTVLLPHGTELYSSQMVEPKDLSPVKKSADYSGWSEMNYIFLTDNHTKDSAIKYSIVENRIKVVGSARFCQEWLETKKKLGLDGPLPKIGEKKIKVLYLMPHYATNIFMDEVFRTLLFLSQYRQVSLIAQIRTGLSYIPDYIRKNRRIYWARGDITTSALIDWSDVLIHAITTMQYEGYQKEKIVIYPRYLLASTALCDEYQAGIILRNRDELRDNMDRMIESFEDFKKEYLKNSSGINDYINNYINPGDNTPVLKKYMQEIETIILE